MTEPYIAEIRMFGFNFAPRGWAKCDGTELPIAQNQALFSLLGNAFGGDGRSNFDLPHLRGRVPVHPSDSGTLNTVGTTAGEESVTLSESDMPSHTHTMKATSDDANSPDPTGRLLAHVATSTIGALYTGTSPTLNTSLSSSAIANNSGGQGVDNMQPFLTVNFCIALEGTFPPRN